jgi:hypothetical protein
MAGSLVLLIGQLAPGLYILLGIGFAWNLWKYLAGRAEYRATNFDLERVMAQARQRNAMTAMIVLLEVALIVLGIQVMVVPIVLTESQLQTVALAPEDGEFVTSTPAPIGDTLDIEPVPVELNDFSNIIQVTPTLTPTPIGTILPAPKVVDCLSEQAQLVIPANGMRVFQPTTVVGTAFTDDFAYSKLELRGPGTFNNFVVLSEQRTPVRQPAEFSQFNPLVFEEGQYDFRLLVFDVTDTLRASCQVTIFISHGLATATPTPTTPP